MIVVVLDTNTLVSGFGWAGPPSVIVDAVLAGELLLVSSVALLDELDRVLRCPKLARIFPDPGGIIECLRAIAEIVEPGTTLSVVADEPDNRVLGAAAEARVDAIATGDLDLRDLGSYDDIPVISPPAFVKRYLEHEGEHPTGGPCDSRTRLVTGRCCLPGWDIASGDAPLALLGIEEGPGIEGAGRAGGELVGPSPGKGLSNS